MIANLKLLYDTAGIAIDIGPQENLTIQPNPNAPAQTVFNIGDCNSGQTPTADQTLLFANRNNAGPTDIVVYFGAGHDATEQRVCGLSSRTAGRNHHSRRQSVDRRGM